MRTYDINALTNIILEMSTKGFDGIYKGDERFAFTDGGLLCKHFLMDIPFPDADDYTGCQVLDVTDKQIFINNKVDVISKELKDEFINALGNRAHIKIVDKHGNYTSYRKCNDNWNVIEEFYINDVRLKGEKFVPPVNIRHDALLQLTNNTETVMCVSFHKAFDEAMEVAKQMWKISRF